MQKTLLLNPTRFFIIILCLSVSSVSFGQATASTSIPGNYTFVVPCDVTSLTVQVWGGGGAGGGSNSNSSGGGGGGAGGSYASSVIAVTPGQVISVFVGSGANGGFGAGANGEGTWVVSNTTIFAQGGSGGAAPNKAIANGGTGTVAATIGSTKVVGSNGTNGSVTTSGAGGAGADPGAGAGGVAVSNSSNGRNGSTVGGGGGGAYIDNNTGRSGGNAGDGQVRITYTTSFFAYCSPSFNNRIDPITNVTFAGINNTTSNIIPGNTNVESFCTSGTVMQGCATNAISVKGNTGGNYPDYYKAYIDWDQNGVFGNSPNEIYDLGIITNSTGDDAKSTTSNISVPSGAVLGNTKMRILKVSFVDIVNPCLTGNYYGQAEDYTIKVIAPITSPSIVSVTQSTCATPTGTINLTGLPATGTWTLNRSGPSTATTTGTGSSTSISGLAAGNYSFTVSVSSCVSASTANIPITALVTTSYNGTSWSTTPTLNTIGVIAATGTISTDVNLCSCTVNSGVTATVAKGVMMRLENELTVVGTGTLTFLDDSSLVQINDGAINSGSIFYQRETTPISNFDYTYWSSPVSGQKLIDFSPNTLGDKFLSFDSSVNNWKYENAYTTFMSKGTGYIIRGPQSQMAPMLPSAVLYQFKGTPHNGLVSVAIGIAGNFVLIGNPYPSAVYASDFISKNTGTSAISTGKIDGTLYFWTHNTDIGKNVSNPGSGLYAYSSDDYATFNLSGGVATAPSVSNGAAVKSNAPNGMIAAGQSFFTTSSVPGDIVFNNKMRVGEAGLVSGSNSDFFKFGSTKKTTSTADKNRIWLDLTNTQGAFKETLVGYIAGATNDYESAFDGESFDGNAFIDFYSISQDKNLTIQGRTLPFDETEIVPLGYTSKIKGEFGINIREKDGFFTTQKAYLEDKLLGNVFDLSEGTYKFTTEIGAFNDRFVLRYTSKTLGIADVDLIAKGITVATKGKVITIQSSEESIAKVFVYDLTGRQLYSKTNIDANQLAVTNISLSEGVLMVKVILNSGEVVTQKVLYN